MVDKKPVKIKYSSSGYRTAVDGAAIFGNFVLAGLSALPLAGSAFIGDTRIKTSEETNYFAPENIDKLLGTYSNSYELPDPVLTENIADKFNACLNARINSVNQLNQVKGSGDKLLLEMLATAPVNIAQEVRTKLNLLLKPQPEDADDLVNIQANLNAIKVYVKDKKSEYDPAVLAAYLRETHDKAIKALENRLQHDKDELEKLFNNEVFIEQLNKVLGFPASAPKENLDQVKKELLAAIDKTHQEAVASYQKEIPDILTKLDETAERASEQLFLLSLLYEKGSAQQRARIDQMRAQQPLTVGQGKKRNKFKGVSLDKLETIQTLSGITITHNTGSNTFTLDIPSSFSLSKPFYHLSRHNHMLTDMITIAKLIKAQIPKREKINVTFTQRSSDDTARLEAARQAYEACRLAGWPEDKINIKVYDHENKEVDINTLFTKETQRKTMIEQKADSWAKKADESKKTAVNFSLAHMKNEVQKTRLAEESRAPAAQTTSPKPPGR